MGLMSFTIDFKDLNQKDSIRLWIPFALPVSKYKYEIINNILAVCESGSRPKGGISNEDEGEAISLGGEQIGADGSLNLSKIPYVSYEFFENAKKGKVKNGDILICKDGALTGKTCWVDFSTFPSKKVMVNEHVYILRANQKSNQKFLFYFTTTDLFQSQVKDLAYKKKAQPGLNLDHFKKIKIPAIPKKKQDPLVVRIEPIEKKIKELNATIKQPQEIINKVFAREFRFDLEAVNKIEQIKHFHIDQDITYRNLNLRSSTM
jgi:restriction endonuclease S subunit